MALTVERVSFGAWAVFDGPMMVSHKLSSRYLAERALDRISREQKGRVRPCLRCGEEMVSTHAGHRMCNGCREWCGAQDPQMVG
jgi:hypothetical protein